MEEQNSIPLAHCFLDTNVFLHFQNIFDTVDWPQVLEAQHVCLMLTTTVMEELNRHKDDAKNPGRQKNEHTRFSRNSTRYYQQIQLAFPFQYART